MELSDLLGRIPAGFSVEIVSRKAIDPGTNTIVQHESVDLVQGVAKVFRFSSIDDVSAALDLLGTAGKQRRGRLSAVPAVAAPTPVAAPDAVDEDDEPEVELVDDDEQHEDEEAAPPPPPPRTTAPGGPVQSQFQLRQASRKAKDKTPIPPVGVPAASV